MTNLETPDIKNIENGDFRYLLRGQLKTLKDNLQFRKRVVCDPLCKYRGTDTVEIERYPSSAEVIIDGRKMINFASNDYLGLTSHPLITEALKEGIKLYGAGTGASALVTGHTTAHAKLEEYLKELTGKEKVLLLNSGFAANQALIKAHLSLGANLILDRLVHASMQQALFNGKNFYRYEHNNLKKAERLLQKYENTSIFTEGVFSMDGDSPDLQQLVSLVRKYHSYLVLDDAHGFGACGISGQGTPAKQGVSFSDIDIYMATLSKACGLCGAFIAADGDFIDYLVNTSKEYIYSTSAPAYIAHGLLTSLKIINGEEGNALRKHLNELTDYFRKEARNLPGNVILLPSSTSIQPLIIGDNKRLMEISVFLKSKGILCGAIRPPTVPAGTARLRITITAAHDRNDITRLLQTLNDAFNSIT